jgi:hypothetical protein
MAMGLQNRLDFALLGKRRQRRRFERRLELAIDAMRPSWIGS